MGSPMQRCSDLLPEYKASGIRNTQADIDLIIQEVLPKGIYIIFKMKLIISPNLHWLIGSTIIRAYGIYRRLKRKS